MNNQDAAQSGLLAMIDQYIYAVSQSNQLSKEDTINKVLIPLILQHLRPLGAKVLTMEDYQGIVKITESLPNSKNIQKLLKDYNKAILEIMEGEEYESDE